MTRNMISMSKSCSLHPPSRWECGVLADSAVALVTEAIDPAMTMTVGGFPSVINAGVNIEVEVLRVVTVVFARDHNSRH